MRDALLAIHMALSPHCLSAALGMGEDLETGYSLNPEEHEALTKRLLGCAAVPAGDAGAVATRVRELLAQVSSVTSAGRCHDLYVCVSVCVSVCARLCVSCWTLLLPALSATVSKWC